MTQHNEYQLAFSHVGFFVNDMASMVAFYTEVMGFYITDRGELNGKPLTFLSRDPNEHHQVVLVDGRKPDSHQNINQISFRVKSLTELKILYRRLVEMKVGGIDPVTHGNSWSMYFHDPEGNRLEVFTDSDWYISQPLKEPLDLNLPEQDIRQITQVFCASRPGYKPIEQWREDMRELMKDR